MTSTCICHQLQPLPIEQWLIKLRHKVGTDTDGHLTCNKLVTHTVCVAPMGICVFQRYSFISHCSSKGLMTHCSCDLKLYASCNSILDRRPSLQSFKHMLAMYVEPWYFHCTTGVPAPPCCTSIALMRKLAKRCKKLLRAAAQGNIQICIGCAGLCR